MQKFLIHFLFLFGFSLFFSETLLAQSKINTDATAVSSVKKINTTTVEIIFKDNNRLTLDFFGDNIFRMFQDNKGGIIRNPVAEPPAEILVENPRKKVTSLQVKDNAENVNISTPSVNFSMNKSNGKFSITDVKRNKVVVSSLQPIAFSKNKTEIFLKENPNEYFFGGGVQNGRFSHKGKMIAIENENSWTDGGVASPTPFYWSTGGYGFMWYTFKKGKYNFGKDSVGVVSLMHETNYLDVFFMVDDGAVALLNDFYQLTGHPVLIPKFGFYQGHLNAYNRDFWKEDEKGILFEDGKNYKESQKDNGGIKESLNGEKNNYQFSARAVVDRYKKYDMPLGWILPNDGYGAGYGQTSTLDSNILNLKSFGDFARKNGVEIGLWTQSDLHPIDTLSALLQRDLVKEVRDAGVRVLKTDVAWVGPGYSFGLNGVADAAHIMTYYGNNARPFIISLDGWAGTQRYATIWSGDQTGGKWEYIRFHIPTYIGSGLSGQPNITSDMDGIFGGKEPIINTRDFQWKTFTPMQLNMDGWGANEKYPQAFGEPITSINRFYLKLKSELLPYSYSIAQKSIDKEPMIKAMFLEEENQFTLGRNTQYQYMYGPAFLVAPIYRANKSDTLGNDFRDGIYLPNGKWYDYFSGESYEGGKVLNNFYSPIWKLPVFVKAGSIIPLVNANNNPEEVDYSKRIYEIYPSGKSSFEEYDDDGISQSYLSGKNAVTPVESVVSGKNALVTILPAKGNFDGMIKNKITELRINVTEKPKSVSAKINQKKIALKEVFSEKDFQKGANVYFYQQENNLNKFSTKGSSFAQTKILKNPQVFIKLEKRDITTSKTEVTVAGFIFEPKQGAMLSKQGSLAAMNLRITENNANAYSLKPSWNKLNNADYYEVKFNDMIYSNINDTTFLLDDLQPEKTYNFEARAVNKSGESKWESFSGTTKSDPLEFAISGITASTSVPNQGGAGINALFDFDEKSMWHTSWDQKAVPFEIFIDLNSVNTLDKFQYLPREAGNGILLKGSVYLSSNKIDWTKAGDFEWKNNGEIKTFIFDKNSIARFVKIEVSRAVGDFGSGRELYIFKVPGTETTFPGDINRDKKIDENDFTSYVNYMGLRKGDGDFDGYVSQGDVNNNGLIDAFDVSHVAIKLEDGISSSNDKVAGTIEVKANKSNYQAGEEAVIIVSGKDLKNVNALSFALPYNQQDWQFVSITPVGMQEMENISYDRLHSNGEKVLYPTFVNLGEKPTLNGTEELFVIRFKAKRNAVFSNKIQNGMIVDKNLNAINF